VQRGLWVVRYAVGRAAGAKEDVGVGEEEDGGGRERYVDRYFLLISQIFREVKWTDRQQKGGVHAEVASRLLGAVSTCTASIRGGRTANFKNGYIPAVPVLVFSRDARR
jgi:hypothetical protein